ncbi:MAG: DNA processing protein [Parcubacteria group bacterium Gr01-1014_18]|nr:MAG: DNA processing protein [Parcubacteria group bacterium Greene0416_36]TSC81282.1 MAG: DNA processing protein [Parcubacteria group bacterium Gr01-1014_18]TSC99304.1 MAG: DNA processing protein [Parcubacteria group bacterium Greene1014_20]TSD06859.1 MAG: DNA processing protein [Parcubacteria group bacterium Greene0714_2]
MEYPPSYYWALFYFLDGFGPAATAKIMRHFPDGKTAWEAAGKELVPLNLPRKCLENYEIQKMKLDPKPLFKALDESRIQITSIQDKSYPQILTEIPSPPALLFYKGDITLASQGKRAAIVGTRKPSPYGEKMAGLIAEYLAKKEVSIVSGLATGIDTVAHQKAMEHGGRTIAVLGNPLVEREISPAKNQGLARQIAEKGLLLSEYPPLSSMHPANFVRRNRIISGLAADTIIVEAPKDSGALITARFALEQNRNVYAVPGDITRPQSAGTNRLLASGAAVIASLEDLNELFTLEKTSPGAQSSLPLAIPIELSAEEKKILSLLHDSPTLDELLISSSIPYGELLGIITKMEMRKTIISRGGRYWIS